MMIKFIGSAILAAWLLAVTDGAGQTLLLQDEDSRRPRSGQEAPVTVITSERLTYYGEERYAIFEKDVTVTDPRISLRSDRLTAYFDSENQLTRIEALGHVYIKQEDFIAWAGEAVYDVVSGQVVLTEEPLVRRGRDTLQGETITYWRDEQRLLVEPGARMTIYPATGDGPQILGGGR